MQSLVMNDIIQTIRQNEEAGNISRTDSLDLIDLTMKLYMKIYSKYEELEDFTMRLYDQSMELASDKYEKTVEELEDEVQELKSVMREQEELIKNLQAQLKELKE